MSIKFFTLLACSLALCACAKTSQEPANSKSYLSLQEAATSVSHSIVKLDATEQAAYPPQSVSEPPEPASYGMAIPASIDWNGPVQPLVQKIADATNYKLRVLGKAPAIPVLISISTEKQPMGDILRNAGYQCGKRAQVVVFPSTHTIELRYAKS